MKVYYIRVSTIEQNTERQKLNIPEGAKVYEDKCSGSIPFEARENGRIILKLAKENKIDTLVCHSIDRLGRNTIDILNTIQFLTQLGVNVISTKEGLSTLSEGKENPVAKMIISVLATLSEFERNNIRERQREGIEQAKKRGVYKENGGNREPETIEEFLNKSKNRLIGKYLREGNSLRRTALITQSSVGLVQKVSAHLREQGFKKIKSVKVATPVLASTKENDNWERNMWLAQYTHTVLTDVQLANKMFSELDAKQKEQVKEQISKDLPHYEATGVKISSLILG